jgi:hypothetical protein
MREPVRLLQFAMPEPGARHFELHAIDTNYGRWSNKGEALLTIMVPDGHELVIRRDRLEGKIEVLRRQTKF